METNEGADAQAPNIRVLKAVVIGLGMLIVIGVVALVVGLFWRASKMGEPGPGAVAPPTDLSGPVALPRGAEITEMTSAGDRVVLRLRLADGSGRLLFIDPRASAVTGQLDLKAD